MQFYFIRHGQSMNNAHWQEPNYKESPDPALTEAGIEQAQLLSEFLEKSQLLSQHNGWDPHNRHGFGLTHIYTSLMERAVYTAMPTARKLPRVSFAAWTEIHESGGIFGRDGEMKLQGLPGKPRAWFEENIPELNLPASLNGDGWWNCRPHEMEEEAYLRAKRVWAELLVRHGDKDGMPEQHVVFVSHGGFFTHLVCAILDLPWRQASNGLTSWFLLNNCSISRFDVNKQDVTICYLNRTDHLPDRLIT
jgi:2,3-bisphosphoglycerate-dependent phosphoglycerate mutase